MIVAKKIEVFQSEYEYLTEFHKEATLELTQLRAERDALKQENERLRAALAKVDYKQDCQYCKRRSFPDETCVKADFNCDQCKEPCPCKSCVDGSNWAFKEKEN